MSTNGSFNWLEIDDTGKTAGQVKAEQDAAKASTQALAPVIPVPVPTPVAPVAPVVSAPVVPTLATAAQSADAIRNVMGTPVVAVAPVTPVVQPTPVSVTVEAPKVTADQLIAVGEDAELTGAMIFWQLGGDCRRDDLAAAWARHELDPKLLPDIATPEVALSRAVKELQSGKMLIQSHPAGGWAIVEKKTVNREEQATAEGAAPTPEAVTPVEAVKVKGGKTLNFRVLYRVYSTAEEKIVVERENGAESDMEGIRVSVQTQYTRNRLFLTNVDMSAWLVRMAGKLLAVPLRDRGGVYFVPRGTLPTFRSAKEAIGETNGNIMFLVPAIRSAGVIETIFHAVQNEAAKAIADVENELGDSKGVGARAAAGRIMDLQTIDRKIQGYEKLIGAQFGGARAKIVELIARLGKSTTRASLYEVD